jgi:CubicO group peptidase (beta-lactamase class C family)
MNRLALAACIVGLLSSSGWAEKPLKRSAPEEQGVSSAQLLEFIEAADQVDAMNSVMLVRHGHVVMEGWWAPYGPKTPHILYSLSKSFTSTAVGLAVAEGKLSVYDEVLKFFPEDAPEKPSDNLKAMRVKDLLRMVTGHRNEPKMFSNDSDDHRPWTRKFLDHPVEFKPGTHFVYNSAATYMQSAIVQKVTGQKVVDYLGPKLFEPLGIEQPEWVESPEGVSAGGYGLSVRTEDIAKFGQLYLQKGEWEGQQLIPADWVAAATSLQTSNGSSPKSDWDQGYGYQFWRCRHDAFRGDGAFGQYCIVLPEQDAVIAITSGVRDMQAVLDLVWDKLLPAMQPKALPSDDATTRKLTDRLKKLDVRRPGEWPRADASKIAEKTSKITGKTFEFPENEREIESISFRSSTSNLAVELDVRQGDVEKNIDISFESWITTPDGFTNGLGSFLSVPKKPIVDVIGSWTADDTLTVKLVLPETPFYSVLTFKFEGDKVTFDSEHHVGFGPKEQKTLVGEVKAKE